jgi:hypothetical protein
MREIEDLQLAMANLGARVEAMNAGPNGLSLRDYFAGQALIAWVGSYSNANTLPFSRSYLNEAAEAAYELADAMLAARPKVQCEDSNVRKTKQREDLAPLA